MKSNGQVAPLSPSSPFLQPHVPPNSPGLEFSLQYITTDQLKQLLADVIHEVRATPDNFKSAEAGPSAKPETSTKDGQLDNPRVRASKLEYKTVDEVYVGNNLVVSPAKLLCTGGMARHTNTRSSNQLQLRR